MKKFWQVIDEAELCKHKRRLNAFLESLVVMGACSAMLAEGKLWVWAICLQHFESIFVGNISFDG